MSNCKGFANLIIYSAYIIKRFRETGEISVRKGQGRIPLLDARGLRALRRHCITHRMQCKLACSAALSLYGEALSRVKPLRAHSEIKHTPEIKINKHNAHVIIPYRLFTYIKQYYRVIILQIRNSPANKIS